MLCLTLQRGKDLFIMNELSSVQTGYSKKYEFTLKDDQCIFLICPGEKFNVTIEKKVGEFCEFILKSKIKFEEKNIHSNIKNPMYMNHNFLEIQLREDCIFRMKCISHDKNTYICSIPTLEYN